MKLKYLALPLAGLFAVFFCLLLLVALLFASDEDGGSCLLYTSDHQDDIIYYPGCEDMADVARQMVEEGYISVPDHLIYYFDYEAYGRDLSMEGTFVETRNGVFEIAV